MVERRRKAPPPTEPPTRDPIAGVDPQDMACIPAEGVIRDYIAWALKVQDDVPALYHLMAIAPAVAYEVCRRGVLVGDKKITITPQLWALLLGPSGIGKSTTMRLAREFHRDWLFEESPMGIHDPYTDARGSWEGISEVLADHFDSAREITTGILHAEEFSKFLVAHRTQEIPERLQALADGVTMVRHTRKDRAAARQGLAPGNAIIGPRISAIFATTYATLEHETRTEHLTGGLYSRMLWVGAEHTKMQIHRPAHPKQRAAVLGAWKDWSGWLAALEATQTTLLGIAPDVHDFHHEHVVQDANRHLTSPLVAVYKRGLYQTYQVAAIFAASRGASQVEVEDMACARALVCRSQELMEEQFPHFVGDATNKLVLLAERTIRARRESGLRRSELYPILKVPKHTISLVIDTLLDKGTVYAHTPKRKEGQRGAIPTRYYGTQFIPGAPDAKVLPLAGCREQRESGDGEG